MTSRENQWFYLSLALTMIIHMLGVSYLASWMDIHLLPLFSDESMEIELSVIQPQAERPTKQERRSIPPPPPPVQKRGKKLFTAPLKEKRRLVERPTAIEDGETSTTSGNRGRGDSFSRRHPPTTPGSTLNREKDPITVENSPEISSNRSPLFVHKEEKSAKSQKSGTEKYPERIKKTIRGSGPEKTSKKNLQYSLNSYQWTFERYAENWATDLYKWWKPPLDYLYGVVPEGGEVWIQIKISREGTLLGYEIVKSTVTPEMELRVTQALVGSLKRPPLPRSFPMESLLINWRFIYPPLRPPIDLRR